MYQHKERMAKENTCSEQIILGVDPGTNVMGYGIIEVVSNKATLIEMDILNLKKIDTHELKIKTIFETMIEIIDKYHPDFLSIEAPFFGKNVQSMLKLGRAQGVAIAAALSRQIPYVEYSPKKIKQSITGNGNASKEQVAAMLLQILRFEDIPKFLDATDGLAAAYCHFIQSRMSQFTTIEPVKKTRKKKSSWDDFLNQNPERVKK